LLAVQWFLKHEKGEEKGVFEEELLEGKGNCKEIKLKKF